MGTGVQREELAGVAQGEKRKGEKTQEREVVVVVVTKGEKKNEEVSNLLFKANQPTSITWKVKNSCSPMFTGGGV